MIHETGSPVPGAGRNSWHYLLQMGLKMLLARLTKALIYSSRCTEQLGSVSQHRYKPLPTLHAQTRTQTLSVDPDMYVHFTAYNMGILSLSLLWYVEENKAEEEMYDSKVKEVVCCS